MLAENVEKGTSIMKVTASDADIGSNADIRYAFEMEAAEDIVNIFDVDAHTGWISTLVLLDKEQTAEYNFAVIASDNGQPKNTARTMVSIKLIVMIVTLDWVRLLFTSMFCSFKDYNDCPPVFQNISYTASVNEDALPGTVILRLSTIDADSLRTPVEYYIMSGDSQSQFQIRRTGELYVAKKLDREINPWYMLGIIATDGQFTTYANVSIDILDINDNMPICLKYRYKETLSEGEHVGTFVVAIQATDADEADNSKLRFFLTGNGDDDFSLDESSGHLKTARQLDRERQSRYMLVAHVQDHDRSGWECSSQIEIVLSDLVCSHSG